MPPGGTVSIDIADNAQSVTKQVKELLGEEVRIGAEDVTLLANGWLRLKRGANNLYISPLAVAAVLVEGGEIGRD